MRKILHDMHTKNMSHSKINHKYKWQNLTLHENREICFGGYHLKFYKKLEVADPTAGKTATQLPNKDSI